MNKGLSIAVLLLVLSACDSPDTTGSFTPHSITVDDIGYYCNMVVEYHTGPKGQIQLTDRKEAVWFTSVRDTIAFTLLPDEPKNIGAIYVTAMDEVDWDHPEKIMAAWIPAESAVYVLNSDQRGGMGQPEAVPFKDRQSAQDFVQKHGGDIVSFADIPENYILGSNNMNPEEI